MKNAYFTKQEHRNPAARPFFNFCAQFDKERLHITPLDIAARRPGKDQLNSSLVSLFHSLNSTIFKYRKQPQHKYLHNQPFKYQLTL